MKKKTVMTLVAAPLLTVVGLYASAWAPRQLDSVAGRIPGHWEVARSAELGAGQDHAYYFGPLDPDTQTGRLTRVSEDGVLEQGSWRIIKQIPENQKVRLSVKMRAGERMVTLTLPQDGKTMQLGGPLGLMKAFESELTYIDAQTSPALFDPQEVAERVQMFMP